MLKKFFNLLGDTEETKIPEGTAAKIEIEGMSCGHCTAEVETLTSGIEGVKYVQVDLANKTGHFVFDEAQVSEAAIKEVIESTGKYTTK